MNDDELEKADLKLLSSASLQLAIDLFSVNQEKKQSIKDANVGFLRNSRLVSFSDMTLNQRRLFDVFFYLASHHLKEDSPHKDFLRKEGIDEDAYGVDLSFFKWLLHLKNPRNDNLKRLLDNIQKVSFHFQEIDIEDSDENNNNDKLKWAGHVAFPSIWLSVPDNVVFFTINSRFEKILKSPHLYNRRHFLNLGYIMPDIQSKLLYDWLLFNDNGEDQFLIDIPFERFKKELRLENKSTYKVFADFNRRFLTPAVEGVNKSTNLSLELDFQRKKSNGQVTNLLLAVEKREFANESEKHIETFIKQYKELKIEFGLHRQHFEEILKNQNEWGAERIDNAKNYVFLQLNRGNKIKSIAAYFMDALRKNYRVGSLDMALLNDDPIKLQEIIHIEMKKINSRSEPSQAELETAQRLEDLENQKPTPAEQSNQQAQTTVPLPPSPDAETSINEEGQKRFDSFSRMPYKQQTEIMRLFMLDPYIEFNVAAQVIKISKLEDMFPLVLKDNNVHARFIDFLGKHSV